MGINDGINVDAVTCNPFFLHHSDNPGLILVPDKLTGDNYASWRRSMSKSLNAKNKLGFVNGTIQIPSQVDNHDEYALWSRCNDMVQSWIVNSLVSDISHSVIYYATAREVWEDLRERFSQSNAPRIYEIQRDIALCRQNQLSVAAYYTKLKRLWDELSSYVEICTCGAQRDRQNLMLFFMGLNDSYHAVRGQVLLMNPLPSVRQTYSSISQEERQRTLTMSQGSVDDSIGAATTIQRGGHDHVKAHITDSQGRRYGSSKNRPHCSNCDMDGHLVETCWKLIGYPSNHPKHKSKAFKNKGDNVTTRNARQMRKQYPTSTT